MIVHILDTSAFVAGFVPSGEGSFVTVSSVIRELTNDKERLKAEIAVEQGSVTLEDPGEEAREQVKKVAADSGDLGLLSETDREVIALAVQRREGGDEVLILTDDYDIQNMARHMGIPYKPMAEKGIGRVFTWIIICKGCKKRFNEDYKEKDCDVCGSLLKRVPKRGR